MRQLSAPKLTRANQSRKQSSKTTGSARGGLMNGVQWIDLEVHRDHRGGLVALDRMQGVPFELKRIFYIFDVPDGVMRANHAVSSHLFLTVPFGSVTAKCHNGQQSQVFLLNSPHAALHLEPGILLELADFSSQSFLLVASSQMYADVCYFDTPMFGKPMTV
jgi:dTDP-4-dehydrorhamnose 3,5-epimerase-like enzyme